MKILFMGDSITDVGRNTNSGSLISIGQGYAMLIDGRLSVKYPGKFTFVNTGISGNRVVDIYARIKADMWNHAPDVLSILIGINDVWHEFGGNGVEADRFEKVLDMYVGDTLQRFPDMKILLMEPFVLDGPATHENYATFEKETKLRQQAVKRVAEKYQQTFLPLQNLFNEACKTCPATYWLGDGVHPTPAGHQIIADTWLQIFEEKILNA